MAKVEITDTYLSNIAGAIRTKKGVQTAYKPSEMAEAIESISPQVDLETLTATQNGTYTPSTGKDGFSQAVVNVPNSYAAGDEGKVVNNGALVAQTAHAKVTQNGTIDTTLNNSVEIEVSGGGGGNATNIYAEAYLGEADAPNATSLSYTITGKNGYYGILCVMHRDTITVSGWTLVDTRTSQGQYVSIYKKQIESASETITITQASSVRLVATLWTTDSNPTITYKSEHTATSQATILNICDILVKAPTLLIYNAYTQTTTTSYRYRPYVVQNAILNAAFVKKYQLRHFSAVVVANSDNVINTSMGERCENANEVAQPTQAGIPISILEYSIE